MYDIGVAIRRFKPLICWTAKYYARPGCYKLSQEDLEAEGLLILVKCCQQFPEGQRMFARYFKHSLYNNFKKLYTFSTRIKRQGEELSIDDMDPERSHGRDERYKFPKALQVIPEYVKHSEFPDRMEVRAAKLAPHLTYDAQRLLELLIHPSEEVTENARREFLRRHKLRSLGIPTASCSRFRVKKQHIYNVLNLPANRISKAIQEIKQVDQKLRRQANG